MDTSVQVKHAMLCNQTPSQFKCAGVLRIAGCLELRLYCVGRVAEAPSRCARRAATHKLSQANLKAAESIIVMSFVRFSDPKYTLHFCENHEVHAEAWSIAHQHALVAARKPSEPLFLVNPCDFFHVGHVLPFALLRSDLQQIKNKGHISVPNSCKKAAQKLAQARIEVWISF